MSRKHYSKDCHNHRQTSIPTVISGIFQIPYKTEKEIKDADSDESDEEESDPWLDFEMGASDSVVRSRVPKETAVIIKDDHGKIHKCRGKFPLTQIFWRVTVKVSKGWLRAAPVYAIREDPDVQKNKLVMIFLSDCLKDLKLKNASAVIACFDKFCRWTNNSSALNFKNLADLLKKYILYEQQNVCCLDPGNSGEQHQQENHSQHLRNAMKKSDLCTVMLCAASHPTLVETISSLLPNAFMQFLHKLELKGHEAKETALQMADKTPWEFMFKDIMYSKLRLQGIEATIIAYENAGYFTITPQTEKDAIYIYEVLKTDSRKYGHTYISFRRLQNYYHLKKLCHPITGEMRWRNAFEYLELNKVIKRESFDCDMNIFLHHNWQAEVDIADGLKVIIQKYNDNPLGWEIDCTSPDFERICSDPDQLRALRMIASSPITVLSGKGGCGKTTVITTLLKHLCDEVAKTINKKLKHLKVKTDKMEQTHEGNYPDNDEDLSTFSHVDDHPESQLKPSSVSSTTSMDQNPAATAPQCHVDRTIAPQSINHVKSEQHRSNFPKDFHLAENAKELKSNVPEPANRCYSIKGVSTGLGSSDQIPSGRPQTPKCERKWPLPEKPAYSKEEKLMREAISDLLKIIKSAKDVDDPSVKDYKERILLTAPTGKAAKLLGSKANLPSATLHSVIMSWRMYSEKAKYDFGSDDDEEMKPWKYSTVEVLVVDECSLVSVRVFARVVNILITNASLRKIVLLGDLRQLPSIEPGHFLTDIFNAFRSVATGQVCPSLELTSNHRSESALIVENAGKISRQVMPTISKEQRFHLVQLSDAPDENERDQAIRDLLNNADDVRSDVNSQFVSFRNAHCMAVNELCCRHYNNHTIRTSSNNGKKERADFRVGDKICLGKNAFVTNSRQLMLDKYLTLDADLQEAVSRALLKHKKPDKGRVGKRAELKRSTLDAEQVLSLFEDEDAGFDDTIDEMTRRDRRVDELKAESAGLKLPAGEKETSRESSVRTAESLLGEDKEKLCNGEVFFIMDEIQQFDGKSKQFVKYFVLSDKDQYCPRVVCAPAIVLRKTCKMRHSWARTIHTFQGSECDSVIYVLGQAMPQNWQHVYTAVTRGKKSVYIVSSWQQLYKAVSRKEDPRRSRLRHRLQEMIVNYKRTLLHDINMDTTSLTTPQGGVSSESMVGLELDFEDSFEDEQVDIKTEDQKYILQGCTSSFTSDLYQETYQHRHIKDDFFNSLANNGVNTFSDEELVSGTNNFSGEELVSETNNFSGEELVSETNKTEATSLRRLETLGFNVHEEISAFSDEEFISEANNFSDEKFVSEANNFSNEEFVSQTTKTETTSLTRFEVLGFNVFGRKENEASTVSDEEFVSETFTSAVTSLRKSDSLGFTILNSVENNETTVSDEELVSQTNNIESTSLRRSATLGFNIHKEETTVSDEELVSQTNNTESTSLRRSATLGFNILNSVENNETTVSDEELVSQTNNTEFTFLKRTEALGSSPENLSSEINICEDLKRSKVSAETSMFSPNKSHLGVQNFSKHALPRNEVTTPTKVRRIESPFNSPFMDSFQHSMTLESQSSSEEDPVRLNPNIRKKLFNNKPAT